MDDQTLIDAIAELQSDNKCSAFSASSFEADGWDTTTAEAISNILNAVATGQLVLWSAKTGDREADFDNDAVYQFARMMRAKMDKSRTKGRTGWNDPDRCSPDYLRALLYEHIYKGDPVDVANICMMLRHYQEATSPKPKDDLRLASDLDAAVGAALAEAVGNKEQLEIWAHEIIEALGFADVLKITSYDDNIEAHDTVGRELVEIILAIRPEAPAALERALTRAREVKPLEFDAKDAAVGIGCRYLLAKDYDGWRWFQTSLGGVLENVSTRVFRERDDVVSAAQADYAARVTAVLQPMGDGQ